MRLLVDSNINLLIPKSQRKTDQIMGWWMLLECPQLEPCVTSLFRLSPKNFTTQCWFTCPQVLAKPNQTKPNQTSRHSVGSPGHRCSPAHSPLATDGLGCCSVLVSASTRRASTSAPSSHSVKTTGRAAAAAAETIYPANTVLLPAEGYRTGSGGGEREIDREFHASQLGQTGA